MLAYNPGVYDRSGEIIAEGTNRASEIQMEAMNQLGQNIAALGAMYGEYSEKKRSEKDRFEGTYSFLAERNMVSPSAQAAIDGFVKNKDYAGANAYIAPYLAELDFGRKAMLSGRSGFFDDSGQWQMAMPAQAVEPRNKHGYRVGGGR